MTYKGTVKGGVIVLEPGATLAEGQQVDVTPTQAEAGPTLYERLKDVVGIVKLPDDASSHKRHYLYGHPRK